MIGETVSHFAIREKLGVGGMGVVYRGEDLRLHRPVAIKFLSEDLASDRDALERFQREARAASALNHRHICTIYDIGEHRGRPFLVMELLEGQALAQLIASGPATPDRLIDIGVECADALGAAHAAGIVHRDIKPANLFVTSGGETKVLDFGLAKVTRQQAARGPAEEDERDEPTLLMTAPGAALGTIPYMSPEQARGEELDARTDLFSLGAVLYELATGRRPFAGGTAALVFDQILNQTPEAPSRLNPDLPAGLEPILGKALEKDRELRYQSAREMATDLRRSRRVTPVESSLTGWAKRAGSRTRLAEAVAVAPNRWLPAAIVAGLFALELVVANLLVAPDLADVRAPEATVAVRGREVLILDGPSGEPAWALEHEGADQLVLDVRLKAARNRPGDGYLPIRFVSHQIEPGGPTHSDSAACRSTMSLTSSPQAGATRLRLHPPTLPLPANVRELSLEADTPLRLELSVAPPPPQLSGDGLGKLGTAGYGCRARLKIGDAIEPFPPLTRKTFETAPGATIQIRFEATAGGATAALENPWNGAFLPRVRALSVAEVEAAEPWLRIAGRDGPSVRIDALRLAADHLEVTLSGQGRIRNRRQGWLHRWSYLLQGDPLRLALASVLLLAANAALLAGLRRAMSRRRGSN